MSKRAILVDDTDLGIEYYGDSWKVDQRSRDQVGNYGAPFRSTLHGTDSSASLSFQFSGTAVEVIGSNNIRNVSGVLDPTWECFVDGKSIGASDTFMPAENNWRMCGRSHLQDGPHTLTVHVTVAKKQTFWFDRIEYIPSAAISVENSNIIIESNDPGIWYGDGWIVAGTANMTQMNGAQVGFEFTGISIAWYSWVVCELPGKATTGSYAVDGGSPQTFNLNGHPDGATMTLYNQKLFETPPFPMGRHNLSVVYNGNENVTPLTLDYIIVQNGTASPNDNMNNPGINRDPVPAPTKKSDIGAIVGGVVAGVCVILLFIVVFIYLRRRRRRQLEADTPRGQVEPFQYQSVGQSSHDPSPHAWGSSNPNVVQSRKVSTGEHPPAGVTRLGAVSGDRDQPRSNNNATSSQNPSESNPLPNGVIGQSSSEKTSELAQPVPHPVPQHRPSDSEGVSPGVVPPEDTGVRNLRRPEEDDLELPPQYTP